MWTPFQESKSWTHHAIIGSLYTIAREPENSLLWKTRITISAYPRLTNETERLTNVWDGNELCFYSRTTARLERWEYWSGHLLNAIIIILGSLGRKESQSRISCNQRNTRLYPGSGAHINYCLMVILELCSVSWDLEKWNPEERVLDSKHWMPRSLICISLFIKVTEV